MPTFLKPAPESTQNVRYFEYKEIIVALFNFLKENMIPGVKSSPPLAKFYKAAVIFAVAIRTDYPDFLAMFYFSLVNALPAHCTQLKNIILHAHPSHIQPRSPFETLLKVDRLPEVERPPAVLCNIESYLKVMNLRESIDQYFQTRDPSAL